MVNMWIGNGVKVCEQVLALCGGQRLTKASRDELVPLTGGESTACHVTIRVSWRQAAILRVKVPCNAYWAASVLNILHLLPITYRNATDTSTQAFRE